jgi:hypothetical protein
MVYVNCKSEYRYRGVLYSVLCSMWSRMPHWTLICLWLAAVTVAMAKEEGDMEKQEGEGDILASVRDILYEDVASNEIETDGPVIKR